MSITSKIDLLSSKHRFCYNKSIIKESLNPFILLILIPLSGFARAYATWEPETDLMLQKNELGYIDKYIKV